MANARRVLVEAPLFAVDVVRDLGAGKEVEVELGSRPWTGNDIVGLLAWQSVNEADMGRLPARKVIATATTGFDNIDTEAAKRRGIWVCNVPEYCVEEVADSTIALCWRYSAALSFLTASCGLEAGTIMPRDRFPGFPGRASASPASAGLVGPSPGASGRSRLRPGRTTRSSRTGRSRRLGSRPHRSTTCFGAATP